MAEWLAAERICERMVDYEKEIEDGIKEGKYQEIHSIEDVIVIKDHEVFHGKKRSGKAVKEQEEEIKRNIMEHYVIKVSEILGHGARVNVQELVPRRLPIPLPDRHELKEKLILHTPNKFLVIRILRDSYRKTLGKSVNEIELEAIKIFKLAAKHLVFSLSEGDDPSSIRQETSVLTDEALNDEQDSSAEQKRVKYSYIPPLIIIKAKLTPEGESEYLTIQRKVIKRGVVRRNNPDLSRDIRDHPEFRKKVRHFISACKGFYKKTDRMPDTVGHGNVLYTNKGNIYLVDINNIAPTPDFKLISLMLLYKELCFALTSDYFPDKQSIRDEMPIILNELLAYFPKDFIDIIVENIYENPKHPKIQEFLIKTNMIDDVGVPIFMHNLDNLYNIERSLLDADLEQGMKTKEEYAKKKAEMNEDLIYKFSTPIRGVWKEKRTANLFDKIQNKKEGNDNWISYYACHLYSAIVQSSGAL